MQRASIYLWAMLSGVLLAGLGCAMRSAEVEFGEPDMSYFHEFARQIEYPDTQVCMTEDVTETPPPMTLSETAPPQFRDLTLQEAITTALTTTEVLRDLQGRVISAPRHPDSLPVQTIQDPAIRHFRLDLPDQQVMIDRIERQHFLIPTSTTRTMLALSGQK